MAVQSTLPSSRLTPSRMAARAGLALGVLCGSAAFAQSALPPGVGVYVTNTDVGVSDASYASSPSVTIYSGGGLVLGNVASSSTFALTSSPTMPLGLTTATLSSIGTKSLGPDGGLATGTASATADLAGGVVRGVTGSSANVPYQRVGPVSARVVTTSAMQDYVTFATGASGADVSVTAHLDGSFALGDPNYAGVNNSLVFNFGGSFSYYFGGNTNAGSDFGYASPLLDAYSSYSFSNETPSGFDFTGILHVTDGERVKMFMGLYLDCSYANCDFGNTARIGLSVPEGTTYTSDSGVFLTAAVPPGTVAAVPEPQTWMLMAAGLMAVLGVGGRIRRIEG